MKKLLMMLAVLPVVFLLLTEVCFATDDVKEAANVVIFAHFSDDTQETADAYFAQQLETYKEYFIGSSGRSFINYMNTVSYGNYKSNVYFPQDDGSGSIHSIPLGVSQEEAKRHNVDGNVVESVLMQMPSLANYVVDCDGDGYIDNITVILKAEGVSSSAEVSSGATLVAHSNTSGNAGTCQGYRVCNYNLLPTERLNAVESGLIIHEYLHTLGYPDLYRTDSSGDSPVYVWDIMGSASPRPSWPLAFLRYKLSNWLNINQITADGTYTLQEQASTSGDRAFIIKSPMNSSEYFVVEYRRRPTSLYDSDSLDRDVQGSGIIVYRINETVYEYSNKDSSQTGIYVFRPQAGQIGYVTGSDSQTVLNAYLSAESGRTSIGSENLNAGLADGALTFSDGSNSGIVISNVGTATGDSITFDVTFPDLTETDLWTDTQYPSGSNITAEDITIAEHQGKIYTVEYTNSGFKAACYDGDGNWTSVSNTLSDSGYSGTGMKCISYNGNLYFMYMTVTSGLKVYSLNTNGAWQSEASITEAVNYFDCIVNGDSVYVTYLSGDYGEKANMSLFTGNSFSNKGIYHISSFANGRTRVVVYGGTPCVFVRDASSPSTLYGYTYQNGNFTEITDGTIKCDDFDVMVFGNHIYAAGANSVLQVSDYNGSAWSTISSDISTAEATITAIDGRVYALASPAVGEQKSFKMYLLDQGHFVQEGDTAIDAASRSFTVHAKNKQMFLSYVRTHDGKAFIKRKEVNMSNITDHDEEIETDSLVGQFVTRLYNVCLSREPDAGGKASWVDSFSSGRVTGISGAYGFIFSNEFKSKSLCNEDYVEYLYLALMGRNSDEGGKAGWLRSMERGMTREEVFNGFATSQEFKGLCASYGITHGNPVAVPAQGTSPNGTCEVCGKEDDVIQFIKRLYSVFLDREPDERGLSDWNNSFRSGRVTGVSGAYGFIFSNEFKSKNLCNEDYIEYLYLGLMGRRSDAGGKADWIKNLEKGMIREEVFNGFAASAEFKELCASYGIIHGNPVAVPAQGTNPTGACAVCGKEDGITQFIKRLYTVFLDREPDEGGLASWNNGFRSGKVTGRSGAKGFVFSKEFRERNYNDTDFLKHLYLGLMGREADSGGLLHWQQQMNKGMTRETVFNNFASSSEFSQICTSYGISRG